MNYKKLIWPLSIALVLGFLIVNKINQKAEKESGNMGAAGKSGKKGPLPVKALLVKTQILPQTLQAGGTLLAKEQTDLRFEIGGKISSIHFEEGKAVKKGQLLVKLDDATLKAQEEKIKTQVKLLEDLEKRQKELLGKEGISQIEYLRSQNELDAALADLKVIREQIKKT